MNPAPAPLATPPRSNRGRALSCGCTFALIAPVVVVLLIAATVLTLDYRQGRANARNERNALRQMEPLARSYANDMLTDVKDRHPSEARTAELALRHDGTLVSYTQSDQSLATVVRFFAAYEDTSFFGSSYSRAYRCYTVMFHTDAGGGLRKGLIQLQKCKFT